MEAATTASAAMLDNEESDDGTDDGTGADTDGGENDCGDSGSA
jgi:hypothetical protein